MMVPAICRWERNSSMQLGALLLALFLIASSAHAQERRGYEGVVDLKKKTIGTVILLEIMGSSVSGWMRLNKFVPIEGGSVSEDGAEFRAAGNTYRIDGRRGRISYSGPDGSGNRLVTPLLRITGNFQELTEGSRFSGGNVAAVEVEGRRWDLRVGSPALWKRSGPPFENFSRLEEVLGREITVWVADSNLRIGRIVVVEEPAGMDIPLKEPKKGKEQKQEP